MKSLRTRLEAVRADLGVPWQVLERDYILSWVLAGIARTDVLQAKLVFKGGTCLKKCFFGDYRFSEDLDFTAIQGAPTGEAMLVAMDSACHVATALLDEIAPIEIVCERYAERDPHPGGQEAFTLRARLPWQREPQTRVMVEVTNDEPVLRTSSDEVGAALAHATTTTCGGSSVGTAASWTCRTSGNFSFGSARFAVCLSRRRRVSSHARSVRT